MSDYESHTGKLRKLMPLEGETFEEQCQRLWLENGGHEDEYKPGELFSEYYEKYLNVNDTVWEIFDHEDLGEDEDMFCKLHPNTDGSYSFHTRFYNGGTYLAEMLSDEIEKLK